MPDPTGIPAVDSLLDLASGGKPDLPPEPVSTGVPAADKLLAIVGRPEWSDDRYSVQSRQNDFLRSSIAANRAWDEARPQFRQLFGVDPGADGKRYEQQRTIAAAKAQQAGEGESLIEWLAQRGPLGGAVGGMARNERYRIAQERRAKGEATDADAEVIARYERLQEIKKEQESTTLGAVWHGGVSHIPAIVGEGFAGGAVLRGAGLFGRAALPVAEVADAVPSLFGRAAAAAPGFLGRSAAQTALMPSMYAEQGAQKRLEHPEMSWQMAYGSAYLYGLAQTAILGKVAGQSDEMGRLGKMLFRTPLGMLEQQGVDLAATGADRALKEVLGHTVGLDTRWGLGGYLARGETNEFVKAAAVQGATFAAFAAMHGRTPGFEETTSERFNPGPLRDSFQDYFRTTEKEGMTKEDAAKQYLVADGEFMDALKRGLVLSREEGRAVIADFPDSLKPHFEARLESLPITTRPVPAPEGAGPLWSRFAADRASEFAASSPSPPSVGPEPAAGTPIPTEQVPLRHPALDALTPEELRNFAKSSGITATGKPETVLANILKSPSAKARLDYLLQSKTRAAEPSAPKSIESASPDLRSRVDRVVQSFGPHAGDARRAAEAAYNERGDAGLREWVQFRENEARARQPATPNPAATSTTTAATPEQPAARKLFGRRSPLADLTPEQLADLANAKHTTAEALHKAQWEPWVASMVENWKARGQAAPAEPVVSRSALMSSAQPEIAAPPKRLFGRPDSEQPPSPKERRIERRLTLTKYEDIPAAERAKVEALIQQLGRNPDSMREMAKNAFASRDKKGNTGLPALLMAWEQQLAGRRPGEKTIADPLRVAAERFAEQKWNQPDDSGPVEPVRSGELLTPEDRARIEQLRARMRIDPTPVEESDVRTNARAAGLDDARVESLIEAARRRGQEAGEGDAVEAISRVESGRSGAGAEAEAARPQTALTGDETEIAVPGGTTIPARYEVRELTDVRASHQVTETGALRDRSRAGEYPKELQPREYKERSERDKVFRFASEMQTGYFISDHPDATSGPPTISTDGTTLNGNGRVMALERSVKIGKFEKYKDALVKAAERFGLDPAKVAAMEKPVLVRVVDMSPRSPEAARFAREGNVSSTQAQGSLRTAASLAGIISPEIIDALRLEGDTTFSEAVSDPVKGRAFRSALLLELPPAERPRYFTPDGQLTGAGKELARDLLISKVLPISLVERLGEDKAAVKRTLESAIPQLLELRRDFPDSDPARVIHEALDFWLRNPSIRKVADIDRVLSQRTIGEFAESAERISPAGRMMLDFVLENGNKPLVFRQKLAAMVRTLEDNTRGLFAEPGADRAQIAADALGVEKREGAEFGRDVAPIPGPDGVFYFGGHGGRSASPAPGGESARPVPGPFETIKTALDLFGLTRSVGKTTGGAQGTYLPLVRWMETQGRKAGDVPIAMHEIAHHIATEGKFESKPAELPPDVAEGLRQFDYNPPIRPTKLSTMEGFAEWFRRRESGNLDPSTLTAEQRAASVHAEKWLADHGYGERADRVREMFSAFSGMEPTGRAATLISPTGKPAEAAGLTTGEAMARTWNDIAKDTTDKYVDRLADAARMEAVRLKMSGRELPKGEDLRSVLAATWNAGAGYADEMAGKGVFTFETQPDGTVRKVQLSGGVGSLLEGLSQVTEKDLLKPRGPRRLFGVAKGKPLGSSRLGTYILGRSVVNETERGAQMVAEGKRLEEEARPHIDPRGEGKPVWMAQFLEGQELQRGGAKKLATADESQVREFKAMLDDERTKNPEWAKEADEVARRYTALNDATWEALVKVGWADAKRVEQMRELFPDYVSLSRVIEGEPYKPSLTKTRKGSGRQFIDPFVTLQARYQLVGHLLAKQLADNALWKAGEVEAGPRGVAGFWKEVPADAITPKEVNLAEVEKALEAIGVPDDMRTEMLTAFPDAALAAFAAPEWKALGKNLYTVRVQGKPVQLEIASKPLYEILTHQQGGDSYTVSLARTLAKMPMLAWMNRVLKTGATSASMAFSLVRNPLRDPWSYIQNAERKQNPVLHILDYLGGLGSSGKRGLQKIAGLDASDPRMALYENIAGEQLRTLGGFGHAGEGEAAFRKLQDRTSTPNEWRIAAANKVKDVLEAMGFAEHGPRFAEFVHALEEMGYTRAKIDEAMKADPNASPVPLNVLIFARQRAARATTDFSRQGSVVAEWSKIAPFFGAHMAGLTQEAGNWTKAAAEVREGKIGGQAKVMLGALAAYTALEVLHWWNHKDEDWYGELPPHLRYNYWVLGRREGGGVWGIPKPQGMLRMFGANLGEALRADSESHAMQGMGAKESLDMLLPRVSPVGVGEAVDVMRNKTWSGKPIVPERQKARLDEFDQWMQYRLPYLMDQLTGGLSSGRGFSLSPLGVSKAEPRQSVDDFYRRFEEVERQRLQAHDKGQRFEGEAEYKRLAHAKEKLELLQVELRGQRRVGTRNVPGNPPSPERVQEIRREQVERARNALQQGE